MKDQNERMRELNHLLATKLASSDDLVAGLRAEMIVKQGQIEDLLAKIAEVRAEMGEDRVNFRSLSNEFQECSKKVTKIDRAQASQQQISMASFNDGRSGAADSRAMSRKGTALPVDTAELDKLRTRIAEIEKILMASKITKKKLGDPEGDAAATAAAATGVSQHTKSASTVSGPVKAEWTQQIDKKLSKLSSQVKGLVNKVADLQNQPLPTFGGARAASPGKNSPNDPRRSQSVLEGESMQSFKFNH